MARAAQASSLRSQSFLIIARSPFGYISMYFARLGCPLLIGFRRLFFRTHAAQQPGSVRYRVGMGAQPLSVVERPATPPGGAVIERAGLRRRSGKYRCARFRAYGTVRFALTRKFDPTLIRQRCCWLRQPLKGYLVSRGSAGPGTETEKLSGSSRHDRNVRGTSRSAARNHQSAGIAFLRWN